VNQEQLAEKLVSWIKDKVQAAGSSGVVLGMSGGIDSSVLAVLCQRAFPKNTLGVIMPCHSDPRDMEHARLIADLFSVPTETVVLDNVFDSLLGVLPDDGSATAGRRAEANLKARLRMLVLYYFANRLGYMVAGSSNRSEISVGYFTKYGDGGVDIMPIGNLVKREVRELAEFLEIPRPIIDKPPSAGLWPGQTDESEMGFTYEELDRYLLTGKASPHLKERVDFMIATGRHKRQPPPIADI